MPGPEAFVEVQLKIQDEQETRLKRLRKAQDEQMAQEISQPPTQLGESAQVALTNEEPNTAAHRKIYNHKHSDGSEFSGTLAEAMTLCPVIGKMSIESTLATLQAGDLASRVAQRGRERRKAEAAKVLETTQNPVKKTEEPAVKLEKPQDEQTIPEAQPFIDNRTDPKIDEIQRVIVHELAQPDVHTLSAQPAKTERIEQTNTRKLEEVSPLHAEIAEPTREQNHAPLLEADESDEKDIEVTAPHVLEERDPVSIDDAAYQHEESPVMPAINISTSTVLEPKKVEVSFQTVESQPMHSAPPIPKPVIEVQPRSDIFEAYLDTQKNETAIAKIDAQPLVTIFELPVPIVKVEAAIEQLAEIIEEDTDEETGKVAAIIETIIALPAKTELTVGTNAKVLEEKLDALFVELFEEADIPYSKELLDSFVKLTKAHYFEELFQTVKESDQKASGLPDEIGTREFLQKLQHGLSTMQRAVINFYELGKSVLRLYV